MKRTQQRIVLACLLAASLGACSYMPWRNTSGLTPATQPSAAAPTSTAPATGSTDNATNGH